MSNLSVDETGVGETGVGKTGVGKMGVIRQDLDGLFSRIVKVSKQ